MTNPTKVFHLHFGVARIVKLSLNLKRIVAWFVTLANKIQVRQMGINVLLPVSLLSVRSVLNVTTGTYYQEQLENPISRQCLVIDATKECLKKMKSSGTVRIATLCCVALASLQTNEFKNKSPNHKSFLRKSTTQATMTSRIRQRRCYKGIKQFKTIKKLIKSNQRSQLQ